MKGLSDTLCQVFAVGMMAMLACVKDSREAVDVVGCCCQELLVFQRTALGCEPAKLVEQCHVHAKRCLNLHGQIAGMLLLKATLHDAR